MPVRTETDSAGTVELPAEVYWGSQTARALVHFNIGQERTPLEVIHALALVKKTSAQVNEELGLLDANRAGFITRACDEILAGQFDDQFPLRVWQSGSGTQSNMNVNEVIANRAAEMSGHARGSKDPVHPNDHVNMGQSTNDCFPTAMHIAAAQMLSLELIPAVERLQKAIEAKAREYASIVKVGRTHLQDATPLMVGQEMSAWDYLLRGDVTRLQQALQELYDLALGGTAVGTGLNSHPAFAVRVAARIAELTGLPFRSHPNKFAALSAHPELVAVSSATRSLAGNLLKIANDIRLLGSGPRCGLGELHLPENEPGSSIMPGKINPTQCEAMVMVAIQIYGNDAAVAFAASQGQLQLNVFKPLIIYNLLKSIRLLSDACRGFNDFCVTGLEVNIKKVLLDVQNSLMVVTALVPRLGYDKSAQIAQNALRDNMSLRDATIALGYLDASEFDQLVKPEEMTRPQRV